MLRNISPNTAVLPGVHEEKTEEISLLSLDLPSHMTPPNSGVGVSEVDVRWQIQYEL